MSLWDNVDEKFPAGEKEQAWRDVLSQTFPSWYVDEFGNFEEYIDQERFEAAIIRNVNTVGRWAAQIEVDLARKILRRCGILIQSFSTMPDPEVRYMMAVFERKPVINLFNQGEGHWKYFAFTDGPAREFGATGSCGHGIVLARYGGRRISTVRRRDVRRSS